MIPILGAHATEEHDAAVHLSSLIAQAWPHVAERASQDVALIAGVKCYGQRVVDLDLVVLVNLDHPHGIGSHEGHPLFVRSLCLTIEVKNHPPDWVRFEGNRVLVKYRHQDDWHDATEQAHQQPFALRTYLDTNGITVLPYVVSLIWLRQVPTHALPTVTHNIIGADATWESLMHQVCTLQDPWRNHDGSYELRAMKATEPTTIPRVAAILTRRLDMTPLDRSKVEAITRQVLHNQLYVDKLINHEQLLIFRGRGGTGKTVRLLQIAHQVYQEQDARVLILTYNRALVADITRLLHLMGITQGMDRRRIVIQTVHAFVYRVMRGLTLVTDDDNDFIDRYTEHKTELFALLRDHALTNEDLHAMMHRHPEDFAYDYLMIDEAQDWPDDERDLLFALYDYRQCVLAQGYDQLIRGHQETDWRATIPRSHTQVVSLKHSLRLKAGLCGVVSTIAETLGLTDWNVQPNPTVYGGRVVIVEGSYTRALHDHLLQRHTQDGNKPIDMLFCVPPTLATPRDGNVAALLRGWGYQVWDGTDPHIRRTYSPTSTEQYRLVQYESCRGLEGWTAVHLGWDTFATYKINDYTPTSDERTAPFFDHNQAAQLAAVRWLMIPLTRAIDTLVIQIAPEESPIRTALQTAAHRHSDLVEWVRT